MTEHRRVACDNRSAWSLPNAGFGAVHTRSVGDMTACEERIRRALRAGPTRRRRRKAASGPRWRRQPSGAAWNDGTGRGGRCAFRSPWNGRAKRRNAVHHLRRWAGCGQSGFAADDGRTAEPVSALWLDDEGEAESSMVHKTTTIPARCLRSLPDWALRSCGRRESTTKAPTLRGLFPRHQPESVPAPTAPTCSKKRAGRTARTAKRR